MKFILLIRGEDKWAELTPEQAQETVQKYMEWSQTLKKEGRLLDADGLTPNGAVLTSQGAGIVVTDGPYAEAREQVGGYYVFTADTLEEAVTISKACPALDYGGIVEIRAIMDYS